MPAPPVDRYLYRCVTDKLLIHMASIEEAGDQIESSHFVGGRDWLLICRKADVSSMASSKAALESTPAGRFRPAIAQTVEAGRAV